MFVCWSAKLRAVLPCRPLACSSTGRFRATLQLRGGHGLKWSRQPTIWTRLPTSPSAAADSLRLLTGADFGLEPGLWRSWADANPDALRKDVPYYYPTFERQLGFGDYIMFWAIPTFEQPGVPSGMKETAPADGAPQNEFGNLGEKG